MKYFSTLAGNAALYCCLSSYALAGDAVNYKNDTLTGDWGGVRQSLANKGVDTQLIYKLDVVGNVSGGIKEGARVLDQLDAIIAVDGEKLFGSHGTSLYIDLLNNDGGRPDHDLVGSSQGFDYIEAPKATAKLYQAWVQQNLFEDKLSVLAGLFDINAEFYVNDPCLLFIHSNFGIGTELSFSGVNGPSTFPFSSAGMRVKVQPSSQFYIQSAILDGVPGDPRNPNGTHIQFNDGDGAFVIAEAGYTPENGKLAVGGWYYTHKFPDQENALEKYSHGAYILGNYKLYSEPASPKQGLSVFAQFGMANEAVNQFDYAWSTGVMYTGLIPGRDEGQLGFGIGNAHNGDSFRDASVASGTVVNTSETNLELTYSDNVTPWFVVQPDIQYIINPGIDPSHDDALVVGTRFTVMF